MNRLKNIYEQLMIELSLTILNNKDVVFFIFFIHIIFNYMKLVIDAEGIEISPLSTSKIRVTLTEIDKSDLNNDDVYAAIDFEEYLKYINGISEDEANELRQEIDNANEEIERLKAELSTYRSET